MAKDRCIQTWLPIRNQKRIASFFPYETGASINACTEEKKKVREREREEGCGKKEKKIVYLANRPVYTFSNMHPSISNARARKDVKKEQRPIGDITDITLVRWRWRGGGGGVCVTKLTERKCSLAAEQHTRWNTTRDALTPSSIIVQMRRQFHRLILVNY